jgi:hypothetical protein
LTELEQGLPDPKDHVFAESNAWTGRPSPIPGHLFAFGVSPDQEPVHRKSDKAYRVRLTEALRFTDRKGAIQDRPAGETVRIPESSIVSISEPYGGRLSRLVGPYLGQINESRFGTYTTQRTALPPPLMREGERVQPAWLYKFLREPFKVRPYTVLRMPKFNMSEDETRALVEYFGAVDRLENPGMGLTESFLRIAQQDELFWREKSAAYVARLKPDQLKAARKELEGVWKRLLADRVTNKEREKEGAEPAIKVAKEAEAEAEKAVKAAKTAADKTKAEEALKAAKTAREGAEKSRTAIDKELETLKKQVADKDLFSSKEFEAFFEQWKESQAYASDAYRLVTDSRSICMTCHSAGDARSANEQGPDLALAFERLRPRWTGQWIAVPNRMLSYPPHMPPNFPNDIPVPPSLSLGFVGSPREHALGARDMLMNLPSIANLPVNRYRLAPKGGK